ncbi:S9 family peptidase [Variovorax sp. UMC13]|uniref:S9 family peptidase n=1 Tax=Variovorax sp. UMC13 TaxID=1862326 RepID=UPI001600597C|nr:S9 family peptidase [Variovorax sp. UMC13]
MHQPFTVQDLFLHHKVTDLHCAPGLDLAACAVRSADSENDSYVSRIWAFALDGSMARQMTHGPGLDQAPCWSPTGDRLAFLSSRGGASPQVFLMQRDGGEACQLGRFSESVTQMKWAPHGRSLMVCAAVRVDPELRGKPSSAPPPERKASAPEIAWRLPYKEDGIGYLLQRQIHLFSLDARSGEHAQITDGAFDVMAFDISADGKQIAYSRSREGRFAHATDLWTCDVEGKHHRRLTREHAIVMQPVWSPDGRFIAFTGAKEDGDAEPKLWLFDVATEEVRMLGDESFDVADPQALKWTRDGAALMCPRAWRGRHQIVSISVPGGDLNVIAAGDRQLGTFALTDKHFAYSIDHPSLPSELWSCALDGSGQRQISDLNPWWKERTPIEAEIRSFEVPDGHGGTEMVEGWLLRQRGANGRQPLLNDMHGGPASYALLDFDTNVFWQVLCARGWSVLALNAVGSSSYGREFCQRLAGHWGEYDLPQHVAAIEQLQQEGLVDERVACSGKSYGGYLSAWATGHTALFRAAVVMAPVGNIETHYGTSDGGYYADPYYVASAPHFDRGVARALSPLHHIEKSRTPTLFLQGKEDERCPKCQSEELFVSLARAGDTPAELVLYPGEYHGFLGTGNPSCREDAAGRIIDWVCRYSVLPVEPLEPERSEEPAGSAQSRRAQDHEQEVSLALK